RASLSALAQGEVGSRGVSPSSCSPSSVRGAEAGRVPQRPLRPRVLVAGTREAAPFERIGWLPWTIIATICKLFVGNSLASFPVVILSVAGAHRDASKSGADATALQTTGCAMSEEHTTVVVQRYLDDLAEDSPPE